MDVHGTCSAGASALVSLRSRLETLVERLEALPLDFFHWGFEEGHVFRRLNRLMEKTRLSILKKKQCYFLTWKYSKSSSTINM